MKITDFKIGSKFFGPANFEWLCTDIGTRTITAIFLDPDKPSYYFQGPPYSVPEKVFDELEMTSCYSDFGEELTSRASSLNISAHPNFSSDDVFKMMRVKTNDSHYSNKKLLKHERVNHNGEILHPYAAKKVDDVWYILVFEIFARKYFEISENDFIQLPFSNEDFLKKRKAQFLTEEKNNYN